MKAPQLFPIPAGAHARPCTGRTCTAMIFDVKQPSGKTMPVSVNRDLHPDCHYPSAVLNTTQYDGAGISHFIDCPDAPQFRRKKAGA